MPQLFYTLADNEFKINLMLKSVFRRGKPSGKSAKLQQNHVKFPLFHVFALLKSEKNYHCFTQMSKIDV